MLIRNSYEQFVFNTQVQPRSVVRQSKFLWNMQSAYFAVNQRMGRKNKNVGVNTGLAVIYRLDKGAPQKVDWNYAADHNGRFREQLDGIP